MQKDNQARIEHLASVLAHDLDQWAEELNDIANVLDDSECHFRKGQRPLANAICGDQST